MVEPENLSNETFFDHWNSTPVYVSGHLSWYTSLLDSGGWLSVVVGGSAHSLGGTFVYEVGINSEIN